MRDSEKTTPTKAESQRKEIEGERLSKGIKNLEVWPKEFQLNPISDTKVTQVFEQSFHMSQGVC